MASMVNLHQLEIFIQVVRHGSFSQAAESLLMSQSAVSQHMRNLETSLGAGLFLRGPRGVTLTAAGVTLESYARQIFELLNEAQSAVSESNDQRQWKLAIGATPGVSVYLMPDWLFTFRNSHPAVSPRVQTDICSEIIEELRVSNLDLGVVEGEIAAQHYPWLSIQQLQIVEQLVVVGPRHPWWTRSTVELSELHSQRLVVRQPTSQTRIWLDQILDKHDLTIEIEAELDNIESIKRAVIIGESMTILPPYAIQQELNYGTLRTISITGTPLTRTLKLLLHRDCCLSPLVESFTQHLRMAQ